MIGFSEDVYAQITIHKVVARMKGVTLNNLPFSDKYDRKTGIESGDLCSYQMDHLPIEGKIILAEHQLNKVRSAISSWRRKRTKDGINMSVGINNKERYGIFKNAPDYLGAQINSALKPLAEVDPNILTEWKRLSHDYESNIHQIEMAHPRGEDCYKKRMNALTPILVKYLDEVEDFVIALSHHYKP